MDGRSTKMADQEREIQRYVGLLDDHGARQALQALLLFPENRKFLLNAARETYKAFKRPE